MLREINSRLELENLIQDQLKKHKLSVLEILGIHNLWETGNDLENNRNKIFQIISEQKINPLNIAFCKTLVYQTWFMVYTWIGDRVNHKEILTQYNGSNSKSISKDKSRMARDDIERKEIIWLHMEPWTIIPFTVNSNTVIMLDKKQSGKSVTIRIWNIDKAILYEDLIKLYNILWVRYFEYS